MDTANTAIATFKLKSSIIFGIDGRMSLIDFSHVGTNKADKTHILEDLDNLTDQHFVSIGFSGDTPLLKEIRDTLPVGQYGPLGTMLKTDFTPREVAEKIRPLVERRIRKGRLYYGIVFAGIGQGKKLEVVYIETTDWVQNEQRPPGQQDFMVKLTMKEMDHYYVTGSGAYYLDEFFKNRYGDAAGKVNIPLDMPLDNAKKLVVEALTYASHRAVGTGGMLQGFIFTEVDADDEFKSKHGDFKFLPFFFEQLDFACCKGEYIERTMTSGFDLDFED